MKLICKTTLLAPESPFIGSILNVEIDDGLAFMIRRATLAEGSEHLTVEWGDGITEQFDAELSKVEHVYPKPGHYRIRLSDDMGEFYIGHSVESSVYCTVYAPMVTGFFSNATKLTTLGSSCFRCCHNLVSFDVGNALIDKIEGNVCSKCEKLSGDIYFPLVNSINAKPFLGCSEITAIHFALANQVAVMSSPGYQNDSTLGTGIADVCRFDL